MKMSVERLRWGLAGVVVLLLLGLAGLVSYGRYAALKKWKQILAKNGIHVTQESDNITISQALKGHTVFTVRAKKAIPIADGKYTLRGVTMLLYGKTSSSVDRVEGDEFEYDEKAGVVKAIGEVHMDIQAPGALRPGRSGAPQVNPNGGGAELDQSKGVIHVLTSGLVYLRKLGVAATDQRVEFRYQGLTCVSKGAEFETGESVLHLLADVELTGMLHGRPAVVRAAKADLDRDNNTIAAVQPVASTHTDSGEESARAANALVLLRTDGSLQHANASGGVLLQSAGRRVGAQRLEAVFGAENAPENAVLSGGVTLEGTVAKPMHGTANEAYLAFTPTGEVSSVVAKGGVRLLSSALHPGTPALAREMRGEQVTARFQPAGKGKQAILQEVHTTGGASVRSEAFITAKAAPSATPKAVAKTSAGPPASGIVTTTVTADDLLAEFAASADGKADPAIQHLSGQGHTRLEQDGLNGAQEISSSDTLDAAFAPGAPRGTGPGSEPARLQTAVQNGHVQIRDQAATQGGKRGALSTAHGDRATFDASTDMLTLSGGAAYQQEGTSLSADLVSVEQGSGNTEAQGHVEANLLSPDKDATHVLADRAKLTKASETAEFFGTDAHPARMWQGGSQVMAADLYLDNARQSLTAKPAVAGSMVEAVFATKPRTGASKTTTSPLGKQGSSESGDAVHMSSPVLLYSGERHQVVCSGGVRVREGDTQVRSQQTVVFLASAPATTGKPESENAAGASRPGLTSLTRLPSPGDLGGTLERMVFSGDVRMDAPGRAGTGEQLVYTAKDGSYVLTGTPGKPPRVAEADQGMVTGQALLFHSGEKSVIVTGGSASNGNDAGHEAGGRVHTDVVVRPQGR